MEGENRMAVGTREVGLYGFVGVLVAALIIAALTLSGVVIPGLRLPGFEPSPPTPTTGTLILKLTDAPVNVTHLNMTIDSVSVQKVEDGNETWVDLDFVENVTEVYFDLLALQDVVMNLSITEILPGNYTMIRMHVKTANVTYAEGGWDDLNVPSEHVRVIVHFEVGAGETTTVLLDMEADWVAISHSKNLRPVLKATVV